MRKIISALLLVALAATTSFAANGPSSASVLADAGKGIYAEKTGGTATISTAKIGKLSTGVHFAWNTLIGGYAIKTQHKSGLKAFGTAYDSTAITWVTATKDTVIAVPTSNNVNAVLALGWSVM